MKPKSPKTGSSPGALGVPTRKRKRLQSPQQSKPGKKSLKDPEESDGIGSDSEGEEGEEPQSLDQFLKEWSESEGEEDQEEEKVAKVAKGTKGTKAKKAGKASKAKNEGEGGEEAPGSSSKYIAQLKGKDPEFYKFLAENDKQLLEMGDSDSESDSDIDESNGLHQLPASLEMASDESDFDNESEDEGAADAKPTKAGQAVKVNGALLEGWEQKLTDEPTVGLVQKVTEAFEAALKSIVAGRDKEENAPKPAPVRFLVKGSSAFNAVVRTCLTHLEPALRKVLKVDRDARHSKIMKSNKWKPLNRTLKSYTMNLTRLLSAVSDPSVLTALLKHAHVMIPYFAALPKSAKHLLTQVISLWSTAEEASVRILAFLCIIKLTRSLQSTMYETVAKQMYLAFVKNAKFTSPSTWPKINFMRRSLAELFALDQRAAYNHAFVYIRQLGISLRNAHTAQKKEQIAAVYNWQFVHSLHLWVQLLNQTHPSDFLEPLLYPLVQIITGCIKLVYTLKYWPLRFHLCQMLTELSQRTDKFIPVLPYYLDILNGHNFNKKVSKISMKPVDFSCILRISKAQSQENGTFDTAIDSIYRGMLEYMNTQGHKIAFPELVVPATIQIKAFLKKTRMANYSKKMKQMLDKASENSQFILRRRKAVPFNVGDKQRVAAWESSLKAEASTPLTKLVLSWKPKKSEEETKMDLSKEEEDDGDQMKLMNFIPSIKKLAKKKKAAEAKSKEEFKGLLPSDEENDDEELSDTERFQRAEVKTKKAREEEGLSSDSMESDDDDEGSSDDGEDEEEEDMDVSGGDGSDEDVYDEVDELRLEDLETDEEEEVKKSKVKKTKK